MMLVGQNSLQEALEENWITAAGIVAFFEPQLKSLWFYRRGWF
jgi:hypothetical protein